MSAYCILKIGGKRELGKIKTVAQGRAAYLHNTRQKYCNNVDLSESHKNYDLIERPLSYNDFFDKRISELPRYNGAHARKINSNAVRLVNMVISPSTIDPAKNDLFDLDKFCQLAKEWVIENFGEENIAAMHVHLADETTPHIHAVFVPITPDGRLCCSDVLHDRSNFVYFQDSIAEKMAPIGLHRGRELSAAEPVSPKEYSAKLDMSVKDTLPESLDNETKEQYIMRAQTRLDAINRKHFKQIEALEKELVDKETTIRQYRHPELVNFEPEILLKKKEQELEAAKQREKKAVEAANKLLDENTKLRSEVKTWHQITTALEQNLISDEDRDALRNILPALSQRGEEYLQSHKETDMSEEIGG